MKTNELRIGNLVNYLGNTTKVNSISGTDKFYIATYSSGIFHESNFEPIPLTEEWLLKFGFEQREFSFDKGSFFLSKRTGKDGFLYQAHTNRFQVKHVHQLQNLYFALTNQELTL